MKNVERTVAIRIHHLGMNMYVLVKRFYSRKTGEYVRKKGFLHSEEIPIFLTHYYDLHGGFYRSVRCAKRLA